MSMIFASILLLFFGRRSATTDRALNRNAQCWAIYSVTATPSSFILSPVVFRYEICHTAASCVCSCMANIDEFASRPNWHFSCSKINKSKSTSVKKQKKKTKFNWLWTRWDSRFIGADFYHFVVVVFLRQKQNAEIICAGLRIYRSFGFRMSRRFGIFVYFSTLRTCFVASAIAASHGSESVIFIDAKQWYCALI